MKELKQSAIAQEKLTLKNLKQYSNLTILGIILFFLGSYKYLEYKTMVLVLFVITAMLLIVSLLGLGLETKRNSGLLFLFNSVFLFIVMLAVCFFTLHNAFWYIIGLIISSITMAKLVSSFAFEDEKYFNIQFMPCISFFMSRAIVIIIIVLIVEYVLK